MRFTLSIVLWTLASSPFVTAASPMPSSRLGFSDDMLPADVDYDPAIPTPASVLGYEVGEWHVRHDQLVQYVNVLAELSPRMSVEVIGYTHERRPLLLASFTTPQNQERLEEIRQNHVRAYHEGTVSEGPVILWMGYSVHGNESSGSNAALLLAYHLAAARGPTIDRWLENAVILLDPCLNPDGLSRFAHWANVHRGHRLVGDPAHREHREAWPGGRTNHYWFDLNRDWLLLTHPESRARLTHFHRWMPNILTDYHEMGSDSSYFFQPGVPDRQNPWTPEQNLTLTRRIAHYHARALDQIGSLYYTEESFDDFYYGKGSTYPDVHGCIGILFEQASSRGHLQENSYGGIDFPFTIRNQFTTSLSTLEAGIELKEDLQRYQADFVQQAGSLSKLAKVRAYLVGDDDDPARLHHFSEILAHHQIEMRPLLETVTINETRFEKGKAIAIRTDQSQYRLIQSLFERRTEFKSHTFYDVSAWNLPMSFNLPFEAVSDGASALDQLGGPQGALPFPKRTFTPSPNAISYLLEWGDYYAPRAVYRLLENDVRVRVATRPFSLAMKDSSIEADYGTIVVTKGIQDIAPERLDALLTQVAEEDGVRIHAAPTGLTSAGIDLGSPSIRNVREPKPLLIIGSGASGYECGEFWHLLDRRYHIPLTLAEGSQFSRLDLDRYTHVVLVNGSARTLDSSATDRLRDWVREGGVLIGQKSSAGWATSRILGREAEAQEEEPQQEDPAKEEAARPSYAEYEALRAEDVIGGTIFEGVIDRTHPLGFGFRRPNVPVFRNSRTIMPLDPDPFANVLRYSAEPLLSGYVSEANLERLKESAVLSASRMGRGTVIRLIDNPSFRGVWYGTNRLVANALFFGGVIKTTSRLSEEEEAFHGDGDHIHDH